MKRQLHLFIASAFTLSAMAQVPAYVPTSGLVAWYPFNNTSNNASSTGNNANNNGATYTDDRFGEPNAAASFDGISAYMTVMVPSFTLSYGGAFTYSVWIKKQVQPSDGIVMMTGSGLSGRFISMIGGASNEVFGTTQQGSPWTYISCTSTLDSWDNYVATYDAGTMNWYKNGVFQATGTSPYNFSASTNLPLYIGKGIGSGNFLGLIDDIGIWDRALTASEITDLYNSITTEVADVTIDQQFTIGPNPASDRLEININKALTGATYDIIDASGRAVMKGRIDGSRTAIDVSGLQPGVWSIRIVTSTGTTTKKVVVQR